MAWRAILSTTSGAVCHVRTLREQRSGVCVRADTTQHFDVQEGSRPAFVAVQSRSRGRPAHHDQAGDPAGHDRDAFGSPDRPLLAVAGAPRTTGDRATLRKGG